MPSFSRRWQPHRRTEAPRAIKTSFFCDLEETLDSLCAALPNAEKWNDENELRALARSCRKAGTDAHPLHGVDQMLDQQQKRRAFSLKFIAFRTFGPSLSRVFFAACGPVARGRRIEARILSCSSIMLREFLKNSQVFLASWLPSHN